MDNVVSFIDFKRQKEWDQIVIDYKDYFERCVIPYLSTEECLEMADAISDEDFRTYRKLLNRSSKRLEKAQRAGAFNL